MTGEAPLLIPYYSEMLFVGLLERLAPQNMDHTKAARKRDFFLQP
jgi:hypothetical protein